MTHTEHNVGVDARMNRRRFTTGMAASAMLPTALGVGHSSRRAAAQDPAKVTFWQFNTEDFIIKAWQDAITAFQTANPDVTVNMEIVPWQEQHQKLVTGLATGGLPDVSMLGNNVVAEFQALGALAPMGQYFTQWSSEVGNDVTADFWPGDKLYYNLNDEWWASPVAEETRCVYYRKDLFEAAGLGTNVPDTFDQARDFALQLTSGDVYGIGIPGGINYGTLQTFMSVYLGYGARFLKDDGTCGFDSNEFRQALTWYTNLYLQDKVCPSDTPTYDNETLTQLFIDGRLAMTIQSPSFWAQLQTANPSFLGQVGIGQVPSGPAGRFGFLGGWPLVLWKSSKNPEAAFRWIRFATDPQGALPKLTTTMSNLPGRRSIVDQAPWNTAPLNVFAQQMDVAYPYQYPSAEIPQMGTLEVDAIQTAVQNVMLGQQTVDEATVALVQRVNDVLTR
jgi:multiple sugar transport system substrate-binding protein